MNSFKIIAISAVLAGGCLAVPALADDKMSSSMMQDNMMAGSSMMSSDNMMSSGDNMMSGGAMGGDMMMTTTKAGEVVAIMPNGQMGTGMFSGDKVGSTVGMASPIQGCMMFITGTDGMVYQVNTSTPDAQKECEGIAK